MSRSDLIKAHAVVEQATEMLIRVFPRSERTVQGLQDVIAQGALTARLPIFAWRETLQDDDLTVLEILVDGADGMTLVDRFERLRIAARYGSRDAMKMFLDKQFHPHLAHALPHLLLEAVNSDRLEVARVLIAAGADPAREIEQGSSAKSLLSMVRSVSMLDLLVEHGAIPTRKEFVDNCLSRSPPRSDLLQRFLQLGAPVEDPSSPAMSWHVLMRTPSEIMKYPDQMLDCARLLLQSGAPRKVGSVYPLPALLLALEAGMPPEEAEASLKGLCNATVIESSQFFRPGDPLATLSKDDFLGVVGGMLGKLEEHGVDLDQFSAWGGMRAEDWARAMWLAGVDPGVSFDFSPQMQSEVDAARLRRTSRNLTHRPASSPRL